ncbi:hypothetical protein CEXT_495651 [Caerostris extrusa]|uniref:Uncharacterized protein n=1 Tax=Caerostris extrusa TaxID=172846 RepID=A0AAV4TKZ5_CAEEX|nr:hypothetical protein CEXT_495651 [Caerostris extrusa]
MWLLGRHASCRSSMVRWGLARGRGDGKLGSAMHLAPRSDTNICFFGFLEVEEKNANLSDNSAADVFEVGRNPIQAEEENNK